MATRLKKRANERHRNWFINLSALAFDCKDDVDKREREKNGKRRKLGAGARAPGNNEDEVGGAGKRLPS